MELPVKFMYTENGVEKTSVDENKRMNYIDRVNREMLKDSINNEKIGKRIARCNNGWIIIEDLKNETVNRHMNDLEQGKYELDLLDEMRWNKWH